MNNNGVNNENNVTTTNQPVLQPMAGVAAPVNASNSQAATSTPQTVSSIPQSTGSTVSSVPVGVSAQTPAVVTSQPQNIPVNTSIVSPEPVVIAPPPTSNSVNLQPINNQQNVKKKKSILPLFLLLIIIGLIFYIVYSTRTFEAEIGNLNYNCTPITASKEDVKLNLNSTLVQDLYNKVYTNIREDIAQPEFNDNMKLYLAYRQVLDKDKYDSNCNLFSTVDMEPYKCEISTDFIPKAFKEETLQREIKKLFGEKTSIPFANIRLGETSCIGGYQYIPNRGEFVQGYCNQNTATSYKVTKTLKEAISNRNTIILKEEVKYHENEKMELPSYLKSGTYYYTFRLDMNYNYVFVSKTYENQY